MMSGNRSGDVIVSESFLEVRAKLLEIAATLDRIDRGCEETSLSSEALAKRSLIDQAIAIVASDKPQRAEELQQLFSRTYESDWRKQMGV